MKKIILPALAAGLIVLSSCSTLDATRATSAGIKALQAATVSDAYVQQSVHQYVQQLDAESKVAPANNPYAQRLARITAPFTGEGLNFKVYITPEINAFCTADGSVRVYTGLMDLMDDNELLGVIGHEIGHYMNHDTRDAFRNALLTSALRDGIASTGGVGAALSNSQLGDIGEALSGAQYSQKQEREADDYGYQFLKNNGVNPWAMAMAFEKMRQMEGTAQASAMQQLFSTHPDLAARAKRMGDKATKDGYSRPAAGSSAGAVQRDPRTGASGTSDDWSF